MANITYLLGAGASANTIPVVDQFKKSIFDTKLLLHQYVIDGIQNKKFVDSLTPSIRDKNPILKQIISEFDWLLEQASNHQTIDTLAKKYFLTDHDKLNRLKKILIIYFALIQIGNTPDLRYDSFIASIFVKEGKDIFLNNNVKIITWNYDLQIELTLRKYIDQNIEPIKDRFQIHPNHKSFDLKESLSIDSNKFAVVKLNGNAFWTPRSINFPPFEYSESLFDKYPNKARLEEYLGDLIDEYENFFASKTYPHYLNYFNFAWESDKEFKQKYSGYSGIIDEAKAIANETDVLVVIGYSFPVFNREIDLLIMNEMKKLRKIYIQDPIPDKIKSTIENAFQIFQDPIEKAFQLESNTNQFIIPYEL